MAESAALVCGNIISLVAFDFILGIIFRSVMSMALVIKIAGVNLDDRPRYPSRLGIPTHVLADFEALYHLTEPSLRSQLGRPIRRQRASRHAPAAGYIIIPLIRHFQYHHRLSEMDVHPQRNRLANAHLL